jgi:proteic killer suppression protein
MGMRRMVLLVRLTYNDIRYTIVLVIVSFDCAETEKIFRRVPSRKFANIQRVALRRLYSLDAARTLSDLAGGGMSCEALKGNRKGQHAIRVNDQYRICFQWTEGNAAHVEMVDYH